MPLYRVTWYTRGNETIFQDVEAKDVEQARKDIALEHYMRAGCLLVDITEVLIEENN